MATQPLSPFGHALAGAIGGVVSNAVVYPLDTVKTKIQAETSKQNSAREALPSPQIKRPNAPARLPSQKVTSRHVIAEILKLQGIGGFYRGFLASMLNTFSMQFAYFYWYTVVRKTFVTKVLPAPKTRSQVENLGIATELALGALAGALAQVFTIPVSVVATRQQLDTSKSGGKSLLLTASEIIRDDGLTGLWRGLKPSLILTVNPAITYGSFEQLKRSFLGPEAKMTPGKAFWIGALSKTLATVITYPYIMAKVRLQAKYESEGLEEEVNANAGPEKKAQESLKRERYRGAIDVLRQTFAQKGVLGWYQGMQAQIMKAVLSQALLFGIKDALEDYTVILMIIFSNFRRAKIS